MCDPAVLQDPVVEGLVTPKTIRHPSPPFNKDEPGVRKLTGVDRDEFTAAVVELRDNVFSREYLFPTKNLQNLVHWLEYIRCTEDVLKVLPGLKEISLD